LRFERLGSWWTRNQEIDIVGLNEETGDIIFGECKWSRHVVRKSVLTDLRRKAAEVPWRRENRREHFILFSRRGFQRDLIDVARKEGVLLFVNGRRVA